MKPLILFLLAVYIPSFPTGQATDPNHVTVQASTHEFLTHYLDWVHQHPGVLSRDASGSPQPIHIPNTYLELFSPAGTVLYRGTTDKGNADFIDSLQQAIPTLPLKADAREYPSLTDYLIMFDELKPLSKDVLSSGKTVLFVTTYQAGDACRAQNEALHRLKAAKELLIVEVDLQHGS